MGFRGGFLGIFHLQIIRERLQAEFGLDVLTTMPNSTYRVTVKNQDKPLYIENPTQFPDYNMITKVEEPYVRAKITAPDSQLNDIMRLAEGRRGVLQDLETIGDMLLITYKMPISEIAYDFFNELKSVSHGFATLSTERDDYDESDLVRLDIQIDYTPVDALTFVMHRLRVDQFAQEIVQKLTELVPRKLQQMPVQAIVEGRVISRGNIPPLRKAAASSGKTSKKQQQMRRQGQKNQIELPQSVFDAILDMSRH
ncbi:Elongation factor 4 [Weissella viridescens]|nr:Elongation factor 4 [Weissella viridescens]